jgi:hypothetical protein
LESLKNKKEENSFPNLSLPFQPTGPPIPPQPAAEQATFLPLPSLARFRPSACLRPTAAQQPLFPSLFGPATNRWGPAVRVSPHLKPTPFLSPARNRSVPPAVPRVPRASLSFKPHHKSAVKPPVTPPPSILPVTLSQAPPLDGNQGRRPPWPLMAICCPTEAPLFSSLYKSTSRVSELPLCTPLCLPHPLHRRRHREAGRRAIAGHPALLVAGDHLFELIAPPIATRVACSRVSRPGPFLPPPNRATRAGTEARPSASISATAASPAPKPSPTRCCGGKQALPRLLLIFTEPQHLLQLAGPVPPASPAAVSLRRPNRPLKSLARFASLSSSHRIKPRCIW